MIIALPGSEVIKIMSKTGFQKKLQLPLKPHTEEENIIIISCLSVNSDWPD